MKIFINIIIILSDKTQSEETVIDNTLDETKNFDVQLPEKYAHGYGESIRLFCVQLNVYIWN